MKDTRTIANEFVRNVAIGVGIAAVLIGVTYPLVGYGLWLGLLIVVVALAAIVPTSIYIRETKQARAERSGGPLR